MFIFEDTKIYIMAPANTASGGPLLLHQLCYNLRKRNIDAYMVYINIGNNEPIHVFYKKFNLPYVQTKDIINKNENILITCETITDIIYNEEVSCLRKVIWWLSVDFFLNDHNFTSHLNSMNILKTKFIKKYTFDKNIEIIHFVQSYYARQFLIFNGIKNELIHDLSDYLDPIFTENLEVSLKANKRNIVVFNPKKGFEYTSKLINLASKKYNIEWIPIINMTPEQVNDTLRLAKVYIDFGNHPGKDRIPREAAMCGCCIITGKMGSAQFFEDVSINEEYKFEDIDENLNNILNKIKYIFDNYNAEIENFKNYRLKIMNEYKIFQKEIDVIFERAFKNKPRIILEYSNDITSAWLDKINKKYHVVYITNINNAKYVHLNDRIIPIINYDMAQKYINDNEIDNVISVKSEISITKME